MRAIFLFLFSLTNALMAEVEVASIFGDHMVLQRGMPVPIWGRAKAGEKIVVRFAEHEVSTTANKSGMWKVLLPELSASSKGIHLMIEGSTLITFKDVVVGEVWICSGQSNMQYGWGKESSYSRYNWGGDKETAALAKKASGRPIRSFHVEPDASFSPKHNCRGQWSTEPSGSAVAFGFSYHLNEDLDLPVGVIVTCWGSSYIEGWMLLELTDSLPHFKKEMEELWKAENVKRVNRAIEMGVRDGFVWLRKRPNLLYNAMLHPLIPLACKGLVWYQGEANGSQPKQYGESLPLWFKKLREKWGREDLQLLAVMLPGFGSDNGHPNSKSWSWFREAQMSIMNSGLGYVVNTIDLGDSKNIHPADKAPISRRLAQMASTKIYELSGEGHGPVYKSHRVSQNTMEISFDSAKTLITIDGESPTGFWIAGEDQKWFPADASIKENTVLLKSKDVTQPVACRYAFSGKPPVNLINENGYPVYPFRTDPWASPMAP